MSRLYSEAAAVLAPSLSGTGRKSSSLKSRTFNDSVSNKKMTHLLVCETLKYCKLLDKTVELAGLDVGKDFSDNQALVYILLYELLIGKQQKIRGGGGLKRAILERETRLRKGLENANMRYPQLVPEETTRDQQVPRFVRVNTLKTTVPAVMKEFDLGNKAIADDLIPTLFKLPPGTDLHDHPLVEQGKLILQDKSSCFPVAALAEQMRLRGLCEYDAIDCCAAPGNKTTQLAGELSGSNARVYAFDKSAKRYELLNTRVAQAGADVRVQCFNEDFLEANPSDERFKNVKTILLDPSCSGSGSFSLDRLFETQMKETDERVLRLAEFQLQALMHAMSFPQAELISYSTCSILHPENEQVVRKALDQFSHQWELIPALPKWPRRGEVRSDGLADASQAKMVAKADFNLGDETGGFFVALFARRVKGITSTVDETRALKKRRVSQEHPLSSPLKMKRTTFVSKEALAAHRLIVKYYRQLREQSFKGEDH